ncbi:MAG: hypothetical protein JNN06_11240 [Gemmobacter sp.]|uniref:hypothetical protein n=1 Tax=Gemmobacter sp. TaxID=1898957 RepID=UPI001A47A809|nr:hypothetical protein [Gemmobacter sp.]MBL8562841.1 hypothetical protein [Gemmobacter sp.]
MTPATRTLTRCWIALLLLAAASTLVIGLSPPWLSLAVLTLAGAKDWLILTRYLGLSAAPRMARGFGVVLALFLICAAALALAA